MFLRLLLVVFLLPLYVSDIPLQSIKNPVIEAISKGNAGSLAEWFAPSVTVSLPCHKGSFSSKQTRSMLHEFFDQNPPESFRVINSGKTTQSNHFILGVYLSEKGIQFSVYVLFYNLSGKERITRITFETK